MTAQELLNQVFGAVADNAGRGADGAGQVADYLIAGGLTAAAVSQLLNGVANNAAATPEMIAYAQNEMRYTMQYQQPRNNTGLFVILGIGALIFFASGEKR